jgi:hypothetical protein
VGQSQIERDVYLVLEITRPQQRSNSASASASASAASGLSFQVKEHSVKLRTSEIELYLQRVHHNPLTCTLENGKFLWGFVQLLESSYLMVVTEAEVVASVQGHLVYKVSKVVTNISITYRPRETIEETRYRNLLQSFDYSQGYYYSYTFDLTHSLQQQQQRSVLASSPVQSSEDIIIADKFVWNYFALKPLLLSLPKEAAFNWVVPVICGFVCEKELELLPSVKRHCEGAACLSEAGEGSQAADGDCSGVSSSNAVRLKADFGQEKANNFSSGTRIVFNLIARRSRHFAGVRYLRRGSDTAGSVANHVETEQIVTVVTDSLMRSSSMVQVRGSIPLFWSHNNYFVPSAPIQIEHVSNRVLVNTAKYSFVRHFADLQHRFGNKITALNLVSVSPWNREYALGQEYEAMCNQPAECLIDEAMEPVFSEVEITLLRARRQLDQTDSNEHNLFMKVVGLLDVRNYLPLENMLSSAVNGRADNVNRGDDKTINVEKDMDRMGYKKEIICSHPLVTNIKERLHKMSIKHIAYDFHSRHGNTGTASSSRKDVVSKLEANAGDEGSQGSTGPGTVHDKDKEALNDGITEQVQAHASDVFQELSSICVSELQRLGVFLQNLSEDCISEGCSALSPGFANPSGLVQEGVLRTNCVDCLDRTNIAQFCYAKESLLCQLQALGVLPDLYDKRSVLYTCMDCWAEHGEYIARQYAGSGAMHKVGRSNGGKQYGTVKGEINPTNTTASNVSNITEEERARGTEITNTALPTAASAEPRAQSDESKCIVPGEEEGLFTITGGVQNAVVAIKRYSSNISSDYDRQQSIDLQLGVYQPSKERLKSHRPSIVSLLASSVALWDMSLRPEYMRFERQRKTLLLLSASCQRSGVDVPSDDELIQTALWVYSDPPCRQSGENTYLGCGYHIELSSESPGSFTHLKKSFSQVGFCYSSSSEYNSFT